MVIATTGRLAPLRCALGSLSEQLLLPREVIIVDQSGSDGVSEMCSGPKWPFGLQHIRVPWRSLTRARNMGASLADEASRWILFLDDDVVLSRGYIRELLSGAKRHSEAKILFGVIDNLGSSPSVYNLIAKIVGLPYHGSHAGFRVTRSFKATMDTEVENDLPAEWATGCGFMVERTILKDNRFDENLAGYCLDEDLDFTFRVGKTGMQVIWCVAGAHLNHMEAPANRLKAGKLALMRTLYDVYLVQKNMRLGLSPWQFALSEVAYTFAIFVATVIAYENNPYPLGPHLLSYLHVVRFWRCLRNGDLSDVNMVLMGGSPH